MNKLHGLLFQIEIQMAEMRFTSCHLLISAVNLVNSLKRESGSCFTWNKPVFLHADYRV